MRTKKHNYNTFLKISILCALFFVSFHLNAQNLIPLITPEDSAASIKQLQYEINRILDHKAIHKSKVSIAVYSLDSKKFLYERNIDQLMTPASNTKIFTSFVSLVSMGSNYLINTSVYSDGKLIADSILKGDVYIIGHGDPLFSSSDISDLAAQIRKRGIKVIDGNIYADGTFFDSLTVRKEYSKDPDHVVKLPPITGLSIEKNTATINIKSGNIAGEVVDVKLIPASTAFVTSNSAKVRGYSRGNIFDFEDTPDSISEEKLIPRFGDAAPDPEPRRRRTIRIYSNLGKDGKQHFTVKGYLRAKRNYSYRYYMIDPELVVAGALKSAIEAEGLQVTGKIGKNPMTKVEHKIQMLLLGQVNRPIVEVLTPLMKNSDNYLAENVFKMIGAYGGNYKDNAGQAKKIIHRELNTLGIPCEECELNDGSGLSRRNLVTAESIVNILRTADKMPFAEDFHSTLSIAGMDGTLEKRMSNSLAENNLHGKTGTLRNVSSLSGFVRTLDGERLAFSFLFNGNYVSSYKDLEDELGKTLANFFYFNQKN